MNLNTFANNLKWKKLIVIGLITILFVWLVHEIMFWSFFHESQKMLSQLSSQIENQQKEFQQKLIDSDREFKEREEKMNKNAEDFGQIVKNTQANINNYLMQVEHEQQELQKSFDKSFREAPDKMWASHEKAGEQMRKEFIKESRQMNTDFNKLRSSNKK